MLSAESRRVRVPIAASGQTRKKVDDSSSDQPARRPIATHRNGAVSSSGEPLRIDGPIAPSSRLRMAQAEGFWLPGAPRMGCCACAATFSASCLRAAVDQQFPAGLCGGNGKLRGFDRQCANIYRVRLMVAQPRIEREKRLAEVEALAGVDIETLGQPYRSRGGARRPLRADPAHGPRDPCWHRPGLHLHCARNRLHRRRYR
jgi:hypothetical protein